MCMSSVSTVQDVTAKLSSSCSSKVWKPVCLSDSIFCAKLPLHDYTLVKYMLLDSSGRLRSGRLRKPLFVPQWGNCNSTDTEAKIR